MRQTLIKSLLEHAIEDERIWFLTGDLGYSVVEQFRDALPQRFLNVGVAEQNMVGVAAGLALSGKIPVIYSIANFPTLRCCEQLRNDVCYHNLPVKIVAVGSGFAYGSAGYSHHGIEDLAIMRSLPNMEIVAACDPHETAQAWKGILEYAGPTYIRIGKGGETNLIAETSIIRGKGQLIHPICDITFVSTGTILAEVITACEILKHDDIQVGAVHMPWISPFDLDFAKEIFAKSSIIISVEEHINTGGLGGILAEISSSLPGIQGQRLIRVGATRNSLSTAGDQSYLRKLHSLDAASLVEIVKSIQI